MAPSWKSHVGRRRCLARRSDKIHGVDELKLSDPANLFELLKAAEQKQWDIVTADQALANAPFEHCFPFNQCIVYLQLEGGDVEQDDAIDRLFGRYKRLSPSRLYTVTGKRVKIRQLPSGIVDSG